MKTQEKMTVTVIVYTFNSSKYILETLDSIKKQTYKDLMLIITDDCSTDSTIEICKKWLDLNGDRFVKTKIITSEKNTGISGNANRGWNACETEYAKDIAGDDFLLPNCIQDNVDYIKNHPQSVVVFSKIKPFVDFGRWRRWVNHSLHNYGFFTLSLQEQYEHLIYKGNDIPAASCVYNIKKLREIGFMHDERIPLLEDYPKWIILIKNGIKFDFFDAYTVGYRIRRSSLSGNVFSPTFFKSNLLLYLYYYQDEIKKEEDRDRVYNLMSDQVIRFYSRTYNYAKNKNQSLDYKLGYFLLSPLHFCKFVWRMLHDRLV